MTPSTAGVPKFTIWHLIYFVWLNIIITTDAGFIAPLISKMMKVFNISLIEMSIYISFMTLIPALLIPIFGFIADKFKRVLIIFILVISGALVSSMVAFIIAIWLNFIYFAFFGILAAIINAAIGPAIFSLIVDYIPAQNRAGVIAWMGIAGTVAIGLGYIVSGIIPGLIFGPNFPLWFPYVFDAVGGFIFAGLGLFLKEPQRGIQEEGLKELYKKGGAYEYTLTFDGAKDYIKKPMNQRLLMFEFFVRFRHAILGTYFITFLIITHGFNEFSATNVMFAIFGIQLLGQVYWGNKGDRAFASQKDGHLKVMIKTLTISLFLVTWVFLIPFNFNTNIGILLFVLFAFILSMGSFFEVGSLPSSGAVLAAVNLPEIRGTASSMTFLITTIGKAIAIPLFAIICINLLNGNYALTFFFFILFDIPAFLILLSMKKFVVPSIDGVQEELKSRTRNETKLSP